MKKGIVSTLIGIPLVVVSLAVYGLVCKTEIEHLILCVTDNTHYMPSGVCEVYLYNFRPTQEDIEEMKAGAGLSFIANIESPEREKLLKHFIDKGLPVNGTSHYSGLTPLHGAILDNDDELVEFLLEHDADPSVKNTDEHASGLSINEELNFLTAPEFLDYLSSQQPNINRDKIRVLLAPYR